MVTIKSIEKREAEVDRVLDEIRELARQQGISLDSPSSARFLAETRRLLLEHLEVYLGNN